MKVIFRALVFSMIYWGCGKGDDEETVIIEEVEEIAGVEGSEVPDSEDAISGAGGGSTPTGQSNAGGSEGESPDSDVDLGDGVGEFDDTPVDPSTLIVHQYYKARFNKESIYGLKNGKPSFKDLGILKSFAQDKMYNIGSDGLEVMQDFGDGEHKSLNTQVLSIAAGDLDLQSHEQSTSGTTYEDRFVGAPCPSTFYCIDRQVIVPVEGPTTTTCFYDPETGESTVIPSGVVATYKKADIELDLGSYGPYNVVKFYGDVDCKNPPDKIMVSEVVNLDFSFGEKTSSPYYNHVSFPIASDYSVVKRASRENNDWRAPYIDETVSMKHKSVSFISEEFRETTKMVVTTRQRLDLWGIDALNNVLGLHGIVFDLELEFCRNEIAGTNHCR